MSEGKKKCRDCGLDAKPGSFLCAACWELYKFVQSLEVKFASK